MSSKKLRKAPLKEVIFELRWECAVDASGREYDKGFDLAKGKFALKQGKDFPLIKKLLPEGMPILVFGSPTIQYWKGELTWPVVQHGQGMIAINDVETNYEWERSFFPLIKQTIESLIESYDEPLVFNSVRLLYIDAFEMNGEEPIDFMQKNLQTSIKTGYEIPGKRNSFRLQQSFDLEDGSLLTLEISSAINNQSKKNSVVWNTVMDKVAKLEKNEVFEWLSVAHDHTSNMFKKMLTPDFYASLDS